VAAMSVPSEAANRAKLNEAAWSVRFMVALL
jgi:hypothetical protein